VAEVWRRGDNGMLTVKIAALADETQDALGAHRDVIAARAAAILAAHHHSGDARIDTGDGDVDKYVILDDSRGLGAAMTIEFGRSAGTSNPGGPAAAVAPLRQAAGIPVSKREMRSRKKGAK
jgi:hypothetical protein